MSSVKSLISNVIAVSWVMDRWTDITCTRTFTLLMLAS